MTAFPFLDFAKTCDARANPDDQLPIGDEFRYLLGCVDEALGELLRKDILLRVRDWNGFRTYGDLHAALCTQFGLGAEEMHDA